MAFTGDRKSHGQVMTKKCFKILFCYIGAALLRPYSALYAQSTGHCHSGGTDFTLLSSQLVFGLVGSRMDSVHTSCQQGTRMSCMELRLDKEVVDFRMKILTPHLFFPNVYFSLDSSEYKTWIR
jgi:hypothetical protein